MEIPELFFEKHPNPMLIFDIDTLEVLEVNKKATKKYGYGRDEFQKLTIEDIRPPEDIPKLRKKLEEIEGESKIFAMGTHRHQTKEGDILYVQITGQRFPLENKNARIIHIHDITETIQLKNEIYQAYHDQQHHINNNPLGMVKFDQNFRIIEWSKRAEEKTGYSQDEMLGSKISEIGLFGDGDEHFVKKKMLEISSSGKNKDRFETAIQLKDGSTMDVMVHASALRDKEDDMKSLLAFIENITERKTFERQLEQRERKYHRLFEDANDGIFLMDDLQFIDCNKRVTDIFGASKQEIIGKTPLDFSPEKQPNGRLSSVMVKEKIKLVKDGKPQVFEWKHQTLDDEMLDVEVSLNKIELGEKTFIQAIVRDLTEHKELKNTLKEEQKRLERAQKLARVGWWSYDVEENRVLWSDVLYNILGVDKESFEGTFEAFYDLVHPEDQEILDEVMERVRHTEELLDYILQIKRPSDNEIVYAHCRAKSEFDDEGNLTRISGILHDITDRKKAQEELKKRKELFESLFLDSPEAIAMIDAEGRVQKVNNSYEKLFGYTEEELSGKDLLKHQLPKERHDEIDEIYEKVFSGERTSTYFEDQRITKSGETKDLLVGALPVTIDGEHIAAFGIYTNISKLRQTEQRLEHSLKEKEILLSEIHHRVKNNLAVICSLLELEAMNWDEDSAVRNVLNQSKFRIYSMASIHEKLYKSQSFATLSFEDYISDLVENIYKTMKGNKKDVEVTLDCDEVSLNINQAVPSALIINELVTNAFKYAFKKSGDGKLEVKFKIDDENVTIVVADNGPGLPNDFESMTEESLGHQLVSQLVKQLQGEIDVKSNEEIGTRYEIKFDKKSESGSASGHFV